MATRNPHRLAVCSIHRCHQLNNTDGCSLICVSADAMCYGGVMKVDEEVACTMVVNVAIGFNVFTGAVLLILGVFAVLILCVGYLVHTNRAMYQQYSQARTNECMSEELDDVPCAADDVSIPDPDEPAAAITP